MLAHLSTWISETVNLLLMDKSNNAHLTVILFTRVVLLISITAPLVIIAVGVREDIKRVGWGAAGIQFVKGLRGVVIGVGFWILVMWAFCYAVGIPPPWETIQGYAEKFL